MAVAELTRLAQLRGGPTFLSFADARHGWVEQASPNGPAGDLYRTADGGRTWTQVAKTLWVRSTPPGDLPCLGPLSFVSARMGWLGSCRSPYETRDGGRTWRAVAVPRPNGVTVADLPRFFGGGGVLPISVFTRPLGRVRAVELLRTRDGGRTWTLPTTKPVGYCPIGGGLRGEFDRARASVAGPDTWWVVGAAAGAPTVQTSTDGGRSWRSVRATGVPSWPCSLMQISAASACVALALVAAGPRAARYEEYRLSISRDGGRTWRNVDLPSRSR